MEIHKLGGNIAPNSQPRDVLSPGPFIKNLCLKNVIYPRISRAKSISQQYYRFVHDILYLETIKDWEDWANVRNLTKIEGQNQSTLIIPYTPLSQYKQLAYQYDEVCVKKKPKKKHKKHKKQKQDKQTNLFR